MADAAAAFTTALGATGAALDPEVVEYVGGIAESVLEEADGGLDETSAELAEQVGPMLEEALSEEQIGELCRQVVQLFRGTAGGSAEGGSAEGAVEGADGAGGDEYLVNCENIIMAFAGRVLLKKSDLKLLRGHKYGLVGQNGVGKSTLLGRIAQKDINGFPTGIKCVFVQHEILVQVAQSVTAYLEEQARELGVSTALVGQALSKVGFTEKTKSQMVSELSGGWRMRLAIAKAILENADLLMLDEPTNHLDVGAVQWLTEYLQQQDTTMVLVSHDYNFLSDVATDIIFFDKGTLGYYSGGFDSFQEQQPQVAAALPGKARSIDRKSVV